MDAIRHNESESRFEWGDPSGRLSVLEYRREDNCLIITHTFVPPECRGQGVAEGLVRAALNFVRAEGLVVAPRCAYVEAFFRRHPEFADLRGK